MEDDERRGTDSLTGMDSLQVLWRKLKMPIGVTDQDIAG